MEAPGRRNWLRLGDQGKLLASVDLIWLLKRWVGFWSFFFFLRTLIFSIMFHSTSVLTGALDREVFKDELSLQKHHTLSPTWKLMQLVYSLTSCQPCSEGTCWTVAPAGLGDMHSNPGSQGLGCCQLILPTLSSGNRAVTCLCVHICKAFGDHSAYLL